MSGSSKTRTAARRKKAEKEAAAAAAVAVKKPIQTRQSADVQMEPPSPPKTSYHRASNDLPFPPTILEQILFLSLGGTAHHIPLSPSAIQPYKIIRWKLAMFRVSKSFTEIYKPIFFKTLIIRKPSIWNRLWEKNGPLEQRREVAKLIQRIVFDYKMERQKNVKKGESRRILEPETEHEHVTLPIWWESDRRGMDHQLGVEIFHCDLFQFHYILLSFLCSDGMFPKRLHFGTPMLSELYANHLGLENEYPSIFDDSLSLPGLETLSISSIDLTSYNYGLLLRILRQVPESDRFQLILAYDADIPPDREMVQQAEEIGLFIPVPENAFNPRYLLDFLYHLFHNKLHINMRRIWLRRVVHRHLNGREFNEGLFHQLVDEEMSDVTFDAGEREEFTKWCGRKVYSYPKSMKGKVW